MPQQFLDKVKHLCQHIAKVEWSGILFYSIEGSIRDPKNLIITLEDILPMHKGNPTYTEYNIDGRYCDYVMEDPEVRMDWKMGHIHSHNSMGVFFSADDWEELNDNSAAHNFYVSLIVNNWMEFTAKIGFRGMVDMPSTEFPYMAQDEEGDYYEVDRTKLSLKKEKLFVVDCDIEVPIEKVKTNDDFAAKVKGIIDNATAAEVITKEELAKKYLHQPPVKNNHNHYYKQKKKHKKKGKQTPAFKAISDVDWYNQPVSHINDTLTEIEIFIITMLRGTNPPDLFTQDIEAALEELEMGIENNIVDDRTIGISILESYPALFAQHYEEKESEEEFIAITEEVIEVLEEHESSYNFISYTILGLKNLLVKFEEHVSSNTTH